MSSKKHNLHLNGQYFSNMYQLRAFNNELYTRAKYYILCIAIAFTVHINDTYNIGT